MIDFEARLSEAIETGAAHSKRQGSSVRALVARLLDEGVEGDVELLRGVLDARGEQPGWLRAALDHEVAAVLSTWGSVRQARTAHRRAHRGHDSAHRKTRKGTEQ